MSWTTDPAATIPAEIEALIFDCDGTLVDTMPAHHRAWLAALAPHGLTFSTAQFHALAGMPTRAIVERLGREQGVACDADRIAAQKDAAYLAAADHGGPIAVVVAIARRERGARKLAVASGNVTELVRATLRGAAIDDLFPVVVGADLVVHGKPAPDVFLEAAARIGAQPARCAVYEDGELGLQAARAAGMIAIDVRPWLHVP